MIEVLCVVWGDSYLNLFSGCAIESMLQPRNRQALSGARFNVFTSRYDRERVKRELSKFNAEINTLDVTDLRDRIDITQSALIWQIRECLKNNSKLFMCPPDTFWVDGSIENLFNMAKNDNTSIAVAHPRALNSVLNEDLSSSPMAVSAVFRHLHRSWFQAEIGHEFQNMYYGGVEWQKVKNNYLVTHLLPTVYLCAFTPFDLKYFELAPCFGYFDHEWPRELYKQNRLSAIGSSDIAFCFEITDPLKNVPPFNENHPRREFWREFEHNKMFKGFRFVFRGE